MMNQLPCQKYQLLLERVRSMGSLRGRNFVAFSGGVDSSLVAHALKEVFPDNSAAVLAVSDSLSREQHQLARDIAKRIGITLVERHTAEGERPQYVANEGMSCYYCKSELYTVIRALYASMAGHGEDEIRVFNGTNAEDLLDPTRVGLQAAREYDVLSPLNGLTKREVREVARFAGLPNWNYAAMPCLRSRLQTGVEATSSNLKRVEAAEGLIRETVRLQPVDNLRVRHLADGAARIETDDDILPRIREHLTEIENALLSFGYRTLMLQAFHSGSLSRGLTEGRG